MKLDLVAGYQGLESGIPGGDNPFFQQQRRTQLHLLFSNYFLLQIWALWLSKQSFPALHLGWFLSLSCIFFTYKSLKCFKLISNIFCRLFACCFVQVFHITRGDSAKIWLEKKSRNFQVKTTSKPLAQRGQNHSYIYRVGKYIAEGLECNLSATTVKISENIGKCCKA